MKYVCTLIAVKDIEKSKQFYREVLEQEVANRMDVPIQYVEELLSLKPLL